MSDKQPSNGESPSVSHTPVVNQASLSGASPSAAIPLGATTSGSPSSNPVAGTNSEPVRQDMLKSAISFLSSPNVQSADTAKKVAFLRKKGLNETEIQEAFKSVNQGSSLTQSALAPPMEKTAAVSRPAVPPRPATMYSGGPPQIRYYEPPRPPVMPFRQLITTVLLVGFGAVGSIALVFKIIKSVIGPIFNRIAAYQRHRYNQHQSMLKKLNSTLLLKGSEETDLASEAAALAEKQEALAESVAKVVERAKNHSEEVTDEPYASFRDDLTELKETLTDPSYGYSPYSTYSYYSPARSATESPLVQSIKSDIRSFKGVLLNRRNFPSVNHHHSQSTTSSTTTPPARDVPDYQSQRPSRTDMTTDNRPSETENVTSPPPAIAEAR